MPPHELARVCGLRGAQRRGRDAAAVPARSVHGEAAPAGADLQHVVVGFQSELAADPLELGLLGRGEVLARLGEHGAGVGQRRVEERAEEVVAQVVVGGDVAACAREVVATTPERQTVPRREQTQRGRRPATQGGPRCARGCVRARPCRRTSTSPPCSCARRRRSAPAARRVEATVTNVTVASRGQASVRRPRGQTPSASRSVMRPSRTEPRARSSSVRLQRCLRVNSRGGIVVLMASVAPGCRDAGDRARPCARVAGPASGFLPRPSA